MDLKIKDVAELLSVSETTVRRWLAKGLIPAYRLNHQFRFSRIEVENWVMSCKMKEDSVQRESTSSPKKIEQGSGTRQFSLFRALHHGDMLIDVKGESKEQIIRSATQKIAENHDWDAEVVCDLLLDRESLMPTSLNHGIGVPHTRDFLLQEPFNVVSVVFPEKPIDYGALDKKPVHTLFFLFATDDKSHLHLLAKLAHLASNAEILDFLKSKPEKASLLQFIKNWEANELKLPNNEVKASL